MPICTCEECINWTWKDIDSRRYPGRELDAPTVKAHKLAQVMKRKLQRAHSQRLQKEHPSPSASVDHRPEDDNQGIDNNSAGEYTDGNAAEDAVDDDFAQRAKQNAIFLAVFGATDTEQLTVRRRDDMDSHVDGASVRCLHSGLLGSLDVYGY